MISKEYRHKRNPSQIYLDTLKAIETRNVTSETLEAIASIANGSPKYLTVYARAKRILEQSRESR